MRGGMRGGFGGRGGPRGRGRGSYPPRGGSHAPQGEQGKPNDA